MAEVISGGVGVGGSVGGSGAVGSMSGVSAHPNLRTSEWPVGTSFASTSSHQQTQSSSLAANTLNAREVDIFSIAQYTKKNVLCEQYKLICVCLHTFSCACVFYMCYCRQSAIVASAAAAAVEVATMLWVLAWVLVALQRSMEAATLASWQPKLLAKLQLASHRNHSFCWPNLCSQLSRMQSGRISNADALIGKVTSLCVFKLLLIRNYFRQLLVCGGDAVIVAQHGGTI